MLTTISCVRELEAAALTGVA